MRYKREQPLDHVLIYKQEQKTKAILYLHRRAVQFGEASKLHIQRSQRSTIRKLPQLICAH